MKRLGVFLPRWNHLKTLLPVMEEARARGVQVEVICGSSEGKPALSATPNLHAFMQVWPWADWRVFHGEWPAGLDAVIAHGVVHDAEMIRRSGIPWVAVDHLHENAWWHMTGHQALWDPWHRVCLSGEEGRYVDVSAWGKMVRTGYTALDGPHDTPAEIRKAYGLPDRYLLVGTAVQAGTIPGAQWRAYFNGGVWKCLWNYKGPSYGKILDVLRDYARATGMALVGKGRWKHEAHRAHRLFDHYFDDEPTDPGRALRLMQGAAAYAGGISGLAVEALAARTPTLNFCYYDPPMADHPGFHALRRRLWTEGIWQAPGVGQLFRVYEPKEWERMVQYLDTVGIHAHYHPNLKTQALQEQVIGPANGTASRLVLEACGL